MEDNAMKKMDDETLSQVAGGEGGAGFDFVQVNGSNTAGDDFAIDPNGERVRSGVKSDGVDVLRGGAGNDTL